MAKYTVTITCETRSYADLEVEAGSPQEAEYFVRADMADYVEDAEWETRPAPAPEKCEVWGVAPQKDRKDNW